MAEPVPLRPLGVGDLFDEAFRVFKLGFKPLAIIEGIALVPTLLLQLGVQMLAPMFGGLLGSAPPGSAAAGAFVGGFAVVFFLLILISVVIGVLAYGALIHAVSELVLGRPVTVGAAYRVGRRHFWRLIGLSIVVGLAVMGMFVTVIGIPFAIYFTVCWAFAAIVLVIEGTGVFRSVGRSRGLVRGRWWRTLGVALLWLLLYAVVAGGLSIPSGAMSGGATVADAPLLQALAVVLSTAISAAVTPLMYVAWVLYYYDLRVRKEGFDLQLRAEHVAPPTPAPASPS